MHRNVYLLLFAGKKKGLKPVSKPSKGDGDANINTHDMSSGDNDHPTSARSARNNRDNSMDEYYQVDYQGL